MVQIPDCLGHIIALIAFTLQEEENCARIKVELRTEPELSRSEVVVLLKSPHCGYCCLSTSFHSFSVILSRLERALQDLPKTLKLLIENRNSLSFTCPKLAYFSKFPKAYSPRPPKEIVAHRHYSPARLTVTDCFSQWLVSFLSFPLFRIIGNLFAIGFFVVGVATDIFSFSLGIQEWLEGN